MSKDSTERQAWHVTREVLLLAVPGLEEALARAELAILPAFLGEGPIEPDGALRSVLNDAFDLLVDVGGALDDAIAAKAVGSLQRAASLRSRKFLSETVKRFPWLAGKYGAYSIHDVPGATKPKPRETTSIYDVPEDRAILSAIHRATNPQLRLLHGSSGANGEGAPRDERVAQIAALIAAHSEEDRQGNLSEAWQTLDRIAAICLQSREEAGKQRSEEAKSGSGASELPSFRASEPEPEPWGRP